MDKTDFANNDELIVLLGNLQNIFREFKNHEEIENEFIMGRLNSKLKVRKSLKFLIFIMIFIINSGLQFCDKNIYRQWRSTIQQFAIATKMTNSRHYSTYWKAAICSSTSQNQLVNESILVCS